MTTRAHWFVAPGVSSGDGSRTKPFHDPWVAFRAASRGDAVHIAAGNYWGRYDRSSWVVDSPDLTVLGGYSRDFSTRTPWQTPSVFAVFPDYEATRENSLITGQQDHSGLLLDGLFFDASGRNTYGDKPIEGLKSFPTMDGPIAAFNAKNVTIRNCVFANSAAGAVALSGDGSLFENNLVINIIGIGMLELRSSSQMVDAIVVRDNAFCFAHDLGPPCGTGADQAIAIRINRPATIQNNVFVSCGNAAISVYRDLDLIQIDRNLFYLTPRDVVKSRAAGNEADITEKNLEELEDVGFKLSTGNTVEKPEIHGLRSEWVDAYTRHLLGNYVKPPWDAANAFRTAAGLIPLTPSDLQDEASKGALAPRFRTEDLNSFRISAKQGYKVSDLVADIEGQESQPAQAYRPIDWSAIDVPDTSLGHQRVELYAAFGFEQNASLLADAAPETHMGIRIYRPFTDDGAIYVLAERFSRTSRDFENAIKYTNGREAEKFYLLRGVYRVDIDPPTSRQKVTMVVEEIVPAPFMAPEQPARPAGRDWFVRAGASGGDGSREKPFRDPFQALDRAEGGDAIHVSSGDYFGKLRSGRWKIVIRNLALLGGYNADFSERDPWSNPTRFVLDAEEKAKGTPEGTVLTSEENSDGLLLDGFIFDGATYNTYLPSGALDAGNSPRSPLLDLRGGGVPITIRNCVMLNAAGAAANLASPSGEFANNLIVNTSGWALKIRADGAGPWNITNNTIVFACDPTARAGTGESSSDGTLLHLAGRATAKLESNIFAFADNYGVRSTLPQQNTSLHANVFAGNLHIDLTDAQYLWADHSTWERRAEADAEFASFEKNTLELPRLGVDPKFADQALARLFTLPSRVTADQWAQLATSLGSSARPPALEQKVDSDPPQPIIETPKSPSSAGSLGDLLASLNTMKSQIQQIQSQKPAASVAEPTYCPVFDWKMALQLVKQHPVETPGAHQVNLPVTFAVPRAKGEVAYTRVAVEAMDQDPKALEGHAIELNVTAIAFSSADASLFPSGLSSDDYVAYNVTPAGESARTKLAVIVRRDTAVSKALARANPTDRLRVQGIAQIPANPTTLAIVVDAVFPTEG